MFIISGGSSGIGQSLAKALAKRQHKVIIIGRRKKALEETASFSPLISYLCADITTIDGRNLINDYLQEVDTINGLVNNAGIIEPMKPLATISAEEWQKIIATNLNAHLFLTQLLFSRLSSGRVLNIGSGAAHFPVAGWGAYCVSKAALAMLTRCWQLEYTKPAMASVMPGIIATGMQEKIRNDEGVMESDKKDFFIRLYEQDKLLQADTVALFLAWLLLDLSVEEFVSKEWDIYDCDHHHFWLIPPHFVSALE